MSKFKIRQVGREGLYNYHKGNKQALLEDQEINTRFSKELNKLKVNVVNSNDELFHSMNSVLNNKENILTSDSTIKLDKRETSQEDENIITPIDDILSSITKDDVKRNKKKRVELNSSSTSLSSLPSIQDSVTPQTSRDEKSKTENYPHSSKYFRRAPMNTSYKNSIRVTLYNKGYEKDLF